MTYSEIDAIIDRYEGKDSAILAILQDIQAKEEKTLSDLRRFQTEIGKYPKSSRLHPDGLV